MANSPLTIDHNTLAHLVDAGAVNGADIVGQPGGWNVVIKYGMTERALATKRGAVRIFKRFETLVTYLKSLGITEYRVNAANYDQDSAKTHKARPDSAERLKRAHEAAAYETWLKAKVTASLAGIDDGSNPIIDDDTWAAERAHWQREAHSA
jgi:hypothetical protein